MAETTDPQAAPAPDNTHWGVAYLREDLQELRLQMREDGKDLRQQVAEINNRIDGVNQSLGQQVAEINNRIDGVNQSLALRIDETNKRIDRTNELIGSRFAWLITTMVALTGILAALIKL